MAVELFGKIKESIDKSVATVSIKSSEFVEVTKFKTQMAGLEKDIEALQATLGKGYYRMWSSSEIELSELDELCEEIKNKEEEMEKCRVEMEELQNNNKKILGSESENKCSVCGAVNKEEAKFCIGCGSKLLDDDMTFCSCGAKIKKSAKFCPYCGTPAAEETANECEDEQKAEIPAEEADVIFDAADEEVISDVVVEEVVEKTVVCQCGEVYPEGTKFCGKCGCKLS